jgi:hypothetical protein
MIDLTLDAADTFPDVRQLLEHLRSGGRQAYRNHTLEVAPDMGPGILVGINPCAAACYGSLTRQYLAWWRARMLDEHEIGKVPPSPATAVDVEDVVDGFVARLDDAAPGGACEATVPTPSAWSQRAVATCIAALLEGDSLYTYRVTDLEHAVQRLSGAPDIEHWHSHKHPDYAGLLASSGVKFKELDRDMAGGLPDALMRVLGIDGPRATVLLGEFAPLVIDRYARAVVAPVSPTALRPVGLRRLFRIRDAAA